MKLREFKNKLSDEINSCVPDVLGKIKRVPINRSRFSLASDELFRRTLQKSTLISAVIMVCIIAFALIAFAVITLMPQEDVGEQSSPTFVEILTIDCENGAAIPVMNIRAAVDADSKLIFAYSEDDNGKDVLSVMTIKGVAMSDFALNVIKTADKLQILQNRPNVTTAVALSGYNLNSELTKTVFGTLSGKIGSYLCAQGLDAAVLCRELSRQSVLNYVRLYDSSVNIDNYVSEMLTALQFAVEKRNAPRNFMPLTLQSVLDAVEGIVDSDAVNAYTATVNAAVSNLQSEDANTQIGVLLCENNPDLNSMLKAFSSGYDYDAVRGDFASYTDAPFDAFVAMCDYGAVLERLDGAAAEGAQAISNGDYLDMQQSLAELIGGGYYA